VLYLVKMRKEEEDKLLWTPSKTGLFGINSFYSVMGYNDGFCFPWKSVWQTKDVEGSLFCLDDDPREDLYHGQSLKETCHCG
jgi:hypothetical protein